MKMDFVDESALEAEEVPEGERGKINSRISGYTQEIEKLAEQSAALLKEYDECRSLLSSADGKLKTLYDKRVSYSVGLAETSGESKVFKEKANAVKAKLQQAQEDISYSTKRIGEIDKEIKRTEDYAGKNKARIDNLSSSCESLRADISALSAKLSKAAQALSNRKDAEKFVPDISIRIADELGEEIAGITQTDDGSGLTYIHYPPNTEFNEDLNITPNSVYRFDKPKEG